jgi:hypothetical protein
MLLLLQLQPSLLIAVGMWDMMQNDDGFEECFVLGASHC